MRKRIAIIILVLIGTVYNLNATKDIEKELLKQLEQTAGNDSTRLSILYQLRDACNDPKREEYYLEKLLHEAELQKNNQYRCLAYLAYMALAYNAFDAEKVNKWMERLEPIARKEKYYDFLFLGKRCAIDMLMLTGEYERETKEANEMLQEAKKLNNATGIAAAAQNISNVYRITNRNEEAAKILEKYYKTAIRAGHNLSLEFSNGLIFIYGILEDPINKLKWIKRQENDIRQLVHDKPQEKTNYDLWLLMTYINYLSYYNSIHHYESAEKYLNLAEKYYSKFNKYNTVGSNYHQARFTYFAGTDQLDKALEEIDALIAINKNAPPLVYLKSKSTKAEILRKAQRYNESLSIYDQIFAVKDSLQTQNIKKQLEQLESDYNANQLLLEREIIDRNQRVSFLLVIAIIFLLIIYIIIRTYNVRIKLKKSEKEMRRMSQEIEIASKAKEHFLSTISSSIDLPLKDIVKEALLLSSEVTLTEKERKVISNNLTLNSNELMKLIHNILDLSRLEAGMMKFQIEEVEMMTLIRNLIHDTASNAPEITAILPNEDVLFVSSTDVTRISAVIKSLVAATDTSVHDNRISLEVTITGDQKIVVTVKGTYLAGKSYTQNQVITNEINRMLVEYLGGTYEIHSEEKLPYIRFSISGIAN